MQTKNEERMKDAPLLKPRETHEMELAANISNALVMGPM
jgi:hypothetical protein